jgi:hypothetical protein
MPLNATLQYVKGLLDGLESPQYAPVEAIVSSAIPAADAFQVDDKGGIMRPSPKCYIWGNTIHEDRQTMPRGPGFKKGTYRLDLLLQVLEQADDEFRETAFPCLFDAVRFAINATAIVVDITDPVTLYQSQILQIGEEFDSEIFIPDSISIGSQSGVRSTARLTLKIEEAYQSLPLAPGNVAAN